jgi:hypothetical protein
MARFIPESLRLETMASGHLCLRLSERIGWEHFEAFAEELLPILDATVAHKTDGVEMRIWQLDLPRCSLRLVYEDFPVCISLESSTDEADGVLRKLHQKLKSV